MNQATRSSGETIIRQVSSAVLTWMVIGILGAGGAVFVGLLQLTWATQAGAQNIKDLTTEVRSLKDKLSQNDLVNQDQNRTLTEHSEALIDLKSRVTIIEQKPLRLR